MGTYEWFDHLPCVAAIVHAETGRLAYVNSDAAEALAPGVAPAELVGVSAYELHPEHAAQWHAENTGVLAAGEPWRGLYQFDGRWYDRRLVPRDGGLVLVASRDVTGAVRLAAFLATIHSATTGDVGPLALAGRETQFADQVARGRSLDDLIDLFDLSPDVAAASLWRLAAHH